MRQRIVIGTAALLALGALGAGAASAGPTPLYKVTCGSTGFTQVSWQRAKLSRVELQWVATSGSYNPSVATVTATPPKGSVTASPLGGGAGPKSVTVTFTRADGSGTDQVTGVPCG